MMEVPGFKLPVAGHAEWQQLCALPQEEQHRLFSPQIQLVNDILDKKDITLQLSRTPPVCSKCKQLLFCTCGSSNSSKKRKRSPTPPRPAPATPPGMGEIRKLLTASATSHAPSMDPANVVKTKPPRQREPTNQNDGQSTWEEVVSILDEKVLRLDRTSTMVEDILRDEHMTLHLCPHTYQVQHMLSLIANIPKALRFKIGVTADPEYRFYTAPWAYSWEFSKKKDRVDYEHMLIIYLSHSRKACAMTEAALIVHSQSHYGVARCANRKNNVDETWRKRNQDSDSEDARGEGPFVVYIMVGKRWTY